MPDNQDIINALKNQQPQPDPTSQTTSSGWGGLLSHPEYLMPLLGALKLRARFRTGIKDRLGNEFQAFAVQNEKGNGVGEMHVDYMPDEKRIHVNNIQSYLGSPSFVQGRGARNNENAWSLGPADMQSVIKELMDYYPEAKTISGHRVSGARWQRPPDSPYYEHENAENYVERKLPGRD